MRHKSCIEGRELGTEVVLLCMYAVKLVYLPPSDLGIFSKSSPAKIALYA